LNRQIYGDQLTEHYFEEKNRVGTLYPEAEPVIEQLRAAYRVGEITNGSHSPAVFGSDVKLDFIVMAQDIGIEKPDAEIFEHAAMLAGCNVTEMMHVGDSLESDVGGSNGVGAVSVWFNPDDLENYLNVHPDYEIRSLSEIPAILDEFQGSY
jgi:HAD superfamily hydrolase (TIGR01549 family)